MSNTDLKKRGRKPKYVHIITLDNINARDIYKHYKYNNKEDEDLVHNYSTSQFTVAPSIVTNNTINENPNEKTTAAPINYLENTSIFTMVDFIKLSCMPAYTDMHCYHDHHPFNTCPIGIPIKYVKKLPDKIQNDKTIETGLNDYYLTFGVFCSFSCCLGYLKHNAHNPLLRNSKCLLYSMYFKLYNQELNITPAPHWELLNVYGGPLSIEEYRNSFSTCKYIITENIKRPYSIPVGKYVEIKSKF